MMAAKDCLKNARIQLGLSQAEFSKLLGVTTKSVCYYEKGNSLPSAKQIRKIVDKLKQNGIDIKYADLMEK